MAESLHWLKSRHLQNERAIWVREPEEWGGPLDLAVFLDAELYRDRVGVLSVLSDLEAAAAIGATLAVLVSYESVESRWRECPCHPPFAAFLTEELLPWIAENYPRAREARERVLVGLSYTGLAAAYVAITAPGRFTKVICQSASFWWNDCWLVQEMKGAKGSLPTQFYLDVGTRETVENVQHTPDVFQAVSQIDGVKSFRDALVAGGNRVNYVEFDGGHDFGEWKKTLPQALRWALPKHRP
jgi:enterochelin esterase-like enzyme